MCSSARSSRPNPTTGPPNTAFLTAVAALWMDFSPPFRSLPFDSACVPHYARLRDTLERDGQIIGGNDMLIAAIALAHDLTVVTHNGGEFKRVPDLRVEDWSA